MWKHMLTPRVQGDQTVFAGIMPRFGHLPGSGTPKYPVYSIGDKRTLVIVTQFGGRLYTASRFISLFHVKGVDRNTCALAKCKGTF